MGVFVAELFPARVRYSGVSLGYNMVGILGGAPAPMIATALIRWTGGPSWPVATYLAANSFISLVHKPRCHLFGLGEVPTVSAIFTHRRGSAGTLATIRPSWCDCRRW